MAIEDKVKCGLTVVNGTPVFVLPQIGPEAKRIFGATYAREEGVWLFPAYFPYIEDVLHDFDIVLPNLELSEKAQQHIAAALATPARLQQPLGDDVFVTPPFAHQREGTKLLLEMFRCALFFDCGLGKTKTTIDALRVLKKKALVLSPTVGIRNWCREVELHSGGRMTVMPLLGESSRAREARLKAQRELRKLNKELKKHPANAELLQQKQQLKDATSQRAAKLLDIKEAADKDVLVVSYDTAKLYQQEIFAQFPYEVIIADESHYMRGNRSQRTKAATALASKACRRILLSGTPTLGNPQHLYGQLHFLAPYIPAMDWFTFQKHFLIHGRIKKFAPEQGGKRKTQKVVVGYKNLDMLNEKVQRIAIRKKKEECLDLPERTIIDVSFEVSPEQKRLYNDLVDCACIDLGNGMLREADSAATVLQKLLQVVSGFMILPPEPICDGCKHVQRCVDAQIKPYTKDCLVHEGPAPRDLTRTKKNGKLTAFAELLDSILAEERNKAIVWCYFIEELNIVEEHLNNQNIGYVRVDGTNSNRVQTLADEFNKDPDVRVYLAQIGTGVAITLNAAAYMIYYGLSYKLDEYLQSIDRNYRIGQNQPVFVYRLVDENSVLSFVMKALEMKEDLSEILTKRIDCALCALGRECVAKGIVPFGEGCLYKSTMKRVITRPRKL